MPLPLKTWTHLHLVLTLCFVILQPVKLSTYAYCSLQLIPIFHDLPSVHSENYPSEKFIWTSCLVNWELARKRYVNGVLFKLRLKLLTDYIIFVHSSLTCVFCLAVTIVTQ